MTPEGGWVVVDEGADLEPATSGVYQPLHAVVEESGYAHDSPEGYAAAVLRHLFAARVYLRAGHHDEAMALAFALGELVNEAGMKEIFEQDVHIGERVREGGARATCRDVRNRGRDTCSLRGVRCHGRKLFARESARWTRTAPRREHTE